MKRNCTRCKILIVRHVWVFANRDFCGKGCICRHQGHARTEKQKYCNACRGPELQEQRRLHRKKLKRRR